MLHTLSLLDSSPYSNAHFVCNICREPGCGPVYHCADCDFDVHVACASATAKQQTHFSHPQHLLHLVRGSSLRHTCDSCGTKIHTASFRCDMCDFDIHPTCVRAPRFIKHPSHPHPLSLSKSTPAAAADSIRCHGCNQPAKKLFYQCNRPLPGGMGSCNFILHQGCASLPSRVRHPKHPRHLLTLLNDEPWQGKTFRCGGCGVQSKGWRFHCTTCNFSLDPGCASSVHEFVQPHPDPVVITQNRSAAASPPSTTSVSHASVLRAVSQAPVPSDKEWEAFEKVLHFAQEVVKGRSSLDATQDTAQSHRNEEDICTTCLEGYDVGNPKKLTNCGHHFHLACILNWMERSSLCPICRKEKAAGRGVFILC